MFDLALALEETGKQIVMAPLVEAAAAIWAVTNATERGPSGAGSDRIEDRRAGDSVARPALRRRRRGDLRPESLGAVGLGVVCAVRRVGRSVSGRCEGGRETVLCLVPRNAAGLGITTTPNVDGSTSSTLTFSRVTVAERRHRRARRCGCGDRDGDAGASGSRHRGGAARRRPGRARHDRRLHQAPRAVRQADRQLPGVAASHGRLLRRCRAQPLAVVQGSVRVGRRHRAIRRWCRRSRRGSGRAR